MDQAVERIPPIWVMGTPVTPLRSYDHAIEFIHQRVAHNVKTTCLAVNPEKSERMRSDNQLADALSASTLLICDGIGVALAARLHGQGRLNRITGVDLFERLIRHAAQNGISVFLLGASETSNEAAIRHLRTKHPKLLVAGSHHGFFDDSEVIVDQINESRAHMVFVAMGSPRQELWIHEWMPHLRTSFAMGIGGTLDVLSGASQRAPIVFRKTGTEFAYRLVTQPRRWRRQLACLKFAARAILGIACRGQSLGR